MRLHRLTSFLAVAVLAACGADEPGHPCSDAAGEACTYAGVIGEGIGVDHVHEHHRQDTKFSYPIDITFAPDGRAWIVDWNNHLVRRVELDDTIATMVGNESESDGTCAKASPNDPCDNRDYLPLGNPVGAPGREVSLNHPTDVEFFPNGDAVISAWHNNKIRIWEAATGTVKVIAGNDYGYRGEGGPAYQAEFNLPKGAAIAGDGTIYILDTRNQKVRVIDPVTHNITTVLGTGTAGYGGDGGPATSAQIFLDKTGVAAEGAVVLTDDYLYVADSSNNRIRRMSLATRIVDSIAGTGMASNTGDGGPAVAATLRKPLDLELGPDGRLFIADASNNVIRALDLQTGIIDHIAGTGEACFEENGCFEAEEGLPADQIRLNKPSGIAFDAAGHLYIADQFNNRIVRIARSW